MLKIAQEGELQLPGSKDTHISVAHSDICSDRGINGRLIAYVNMPGDTGDCPQHLLWALDTSLGAALCGREGRNMLSWLLIKAVELQSALS